LPFPDEDIWQQIDVWDLLKTFSSLVFSLSAEQIIDLYEEVTINEKITLIRELIEEHEEFLFTDILLKSRSLLAVICSFLAILEMVKSKEIIVYQNKMFGDIRIKAASTTAVT
jgi:segregation and condensation protein A